MSAYVFFQLKKMGYNCELVTEYIKSWTYLNRKPESFDEVYTFAQQLHRVDIALRGGFDFIITDSPLFLSYYYATFLGCSFAEHIYNICTHVEEVYPSYNIMVDRKDKSYDPIARYQTIDEVSKIDFDIENNILKLINYVTFPYYEQEKVLQNVVRALK